MIADWIPNQVGNDDIILSLGFTAAGLDQRYALCAEGTIFRVIGDNLGAMAGIERYAEYRLVSGT